jgi:hypothetical protein
VTFQAGPTVDLDGLRQLIAKIEEPLIVDHHSSSRSAM